MCRPRRCATATSRNLRNAAGPADRHLRSADHRCRGQPSAVPRQHHPGRTASTRRAGIRQRAADADARYPSLDDGNINLPAQDIIQSKAHQESLKLDHHFSDAISLSGIYLRQSSFEPDANYFPEARYAAPAFHLHRDVNVFVLNNTLHHQPDDGGDAPVRHEHVQRRQRRCRTRSTCTMCPASIRRLPTRSPSRSSRR